MLRNAQSGFSNMAKPKNFIFSIFLKFFLNFKNDMCFKMQLKIIDYKISKLLPCMSRFDAQEGPKGVLKESYTKIFFFNFPQFFLRIEKSTFFEA